jgi:hypothetical protein
LKSLSSRAILKVVKSGIDTNRFALQSKGSFDTARSPAGESMRKELALRRDSSERSSLCFVYPDEHDPIRVFDFLCVSWTRHLHCGCRRRATILGMAEQKVPLGDKLCHCGFMLTLTALANLTLKARAIRLGQIMLLLGTVIVTILVVGEECSQYWIPSRNFDLFDLSADLVGIACGDLIARRLHRENRATA